MKIAYFAFTQEGRATAERIYKKFGGKLESKENFSQNVKNDFSECDALVFVMAAGIVVRTIAPLIQDKTHDPAVIVADQQGKFVISLLSGHIGGANCLAEKIAESINAIPVITTATDIQKVTAFDLFAQKNNLVIENISELKYISSTLLDNKSVEFFTDFPVNDSDIPENIILTDKPSGKMRVVVSDMLRHDLSENSHTLFLRPKSLIVGIGCKKNIDFLKLENCFLSFLENYNLSLLSVESISTVSLKSKEPAVLKLCEKYNIPLKIVPDEAILSCSHDFEKSQFVEKITGLPSVAQASCYIASDYGTEISGKVKFSGITLAVCRKKNKILKFDWS